MTELVDAEARRIITTELDRNLFVEAGAGSGKTSSLVERIVNLVDHGGVPVNRIAAITFTEAAARELRTRVRDALEERATAEGKRALEKAAGQVESAAFTTLHGFALRLLTDHPIEAGLPPGFGVVDEITSTLEFDESWRIFVGRVGDDRSLEDLQVRAAALGIELGQFAGVARRFDDNWDLLELVDPEPPVLSTIGFDDLLDGVEDLAELGRACAVPDDLYHRALQAYVDEVRRLALKDPIDQLQLIAGLKLPHRRRGRKEAWRVPIDQVRAEVEAFHTAMQDRLRDYRHEVMDYFVTLVGDFVGGRVEARQVRGELAFHDLLVLARRLLRTDDGVRRTLHQRYTRLLLDEFQDTDPIQIELAVLLAAPGPVEGRPWTELIGEIEPGRLVVVGDPKQSIYRFRRADIGVYSQTEQALAGEATRLSTNFRSVPAILGWVNHVFGQAMGEGEPGVQPAYGPLDPVRPAAPPPTGSRPVGPAPVVVLGQPHPPDVGVHAIRGAEALDVAAVACRIVAEEWPVQRDGPWLPARLSDIAVLVPSRLSLPALEAAFAAADVPFRPETSSLVYATQEVRDVLAGVRAVVDPTNSVDVVAALRSALFAVGDDDLLTWKLAGGSWDYRVRHLEDPGGANPLLVDGELVDRPDDRPRFEDLADHPVARAFEVLGRWHAERWWTTPAALIDRMVRERRLREAALAEPRPRDRWRRYRFLAEQAREFAETQGGDLHDFVAWVEVQSSDLARVTEPIPPEPDDDAVRVLTMHGSKGLEFPVVILAGAPTVEASIRPGPKVLFPPGRRPEVTLGRDRQTAEYDMHASVEEILDANERIRLHYVAATRARDHLVVSVHHKEGGRTSIGRRTWELLAPAEAEPEQGGGWQQFERRGDERHLARPPTQLRLAGGGYRDEADTWGETQHRIVEEVARARPRSASDLAAEAPARGWGEPPVTESAMVSDPGVGGTALGLAVHAVLEVVDFDDPGPLARLAEARAAQFGVPELAAEVQRRVRLVLDGPTIDLARRVRHHRELPVVSVIGDRVVEGVVDLCLETDDGLLVVDYKTDRLVGPDPRAAAEAKAHSYRSQGATYAILLGGLTDRPVVGCRFVFVGADEVIEVDLDDLAGAVDEVVQLVAAPGS